MAFRFDVPSLGSSPHVRGAHARHQRFAVTAGIIPACAGSTDWTVYDPVRHGDHPRMCGEHMPWSRSRACVLGSSPHVRGAHTQKRHPTRLRGIIPACAGSTTNDYDFDTPRRDHPRMCGEHGSGDCSLTLPAGSSPHVRGARHAHHLHTPVRGIIPACAGSTGRWRDEKRNVRDHPRMCGEHEAWSPQHTMQAGSSPHVRGARDLIAIPSAVVGIIPACAGST